MDLETLRALLDAVVRKMEDLSKSLINEKGEVREFTDTERELFEKLEREAEQHKGAIARAEKVASLRSDVDRLGQPAGKSPRVEVTREANHNEDGEYRGYAPIEKGGFGDFLKDVVIATRSGEKDVPKRLQELRAGTGANEGIGYEGGSLVQSDHAEQLFTNVKEADKLASRCTEIVTSTNSFSMALSDESSLAIGSQFGGVRAYWRGEGSSVTATKPKIREARGKLGALEALMYATEEQLEDAPQLASFAKVAFPTTMAYQLGDAILHGDGASQPLGILNSPCTIEIAKESGQTAGSLLYANIDNMVDRLLPGTEEGAVLYIHPSNRQKLRNVYTTPGSNTDFMPFLMLGGGQAGQQRDPINGFPIERLQQCKAPGTKGDIILANLSHYYLLRKQGIRASESMHVAFLTSERVFKWTMRAHGMPMYNKPITDANGSVTRSPFIVLATRA